MLDPEEQIPQTVSWVGRFIGCMLVVSAMVMATVILVLSVKVLHWALFS